MTHHGTIHSRHAANGLQKSGPQRPAPSQTEAGAGPAFAWLLIVTGALGALASFVITIDKLQLLQDPTFSPSCNLSPVLSCTSVMSSDQAALFGFPNPLLGLLLYPAVITIGCALLAGARLRRWFWLGLNLVTLLGVGFCMWLMAQALYEIGTLCLWCCLTWAVTIAQFWYVTARNLAQGVLTAPRAVVAWTREFRWVVPVTWYLTIVMLIATRFWSYWRTLI
ncbi:Vitamin K epoxide reductase [Streptomyces pluripotens]|uniref:Vitamin K epoxide reductase n=1 Tax=Streptomyces pluripotens TaxID=1355015 RepID=A0A221P760_9ACTN|nr:MULTISPECIES: vitamin K epoxide reductase family protein [Streptomyces]ARP73726.1 Vitamin K epoxide reductase [Streptomyces pluripotens]ASN27972.1 Vitamin K epoxide reductase [Streptomyces pluripotens]KIE24316.1 Vitamin K epoxide reductase [Streptomyces sp. MUSC 125]MCH0559410.1 vitamin K epoxide reductase family protein [Streptomyces sp. MUM 16J]